MERWPHAERPQYLPRYHFDAGWVSSQRVWQRLYGGRELPKIAYHYTDASALLSIVKGGEMWLSDATFLNDTTEIEVGIERANREFLHAIESAEHVEVKAMLEQARNRLVSGRRPDVYVCCFSWESDDLAQWRSYGAAGTGVALGLNWGPLMFGYSSESLIHEVCYSVSEQEWILRTVIDAHATSFGEDLLDPPIFPQDPTKRRTSEEMRVMCSLQLYSRLWQYIVACKSVAFQAEREVRFVYLAHDFKEWSDGGWTPEHQKPLFRVRDGLLIPYLTSRMLEMKFDGKTTGNRQPALPIAEIVVGPCQDQGPFSRGLKKLLELHGHRSVPIRLSEVPFRG